MPKEFFRNNTYLTGFITFLHQAAAMESKSIDELKVAFIPFAAPGHMIPLMDIARIFARQGADVTFITTTANALRFRQDVDSDATSGYKIKLYALQLPYAQVGLPPGVESFSESTSMEMAGKLSRALGLLESQIEEFLFQIKVDCIVSDTIMSWTVDTATRLGIPRLVFHCSGYIAVCIEECINRHEQELKAESDTELFELPGLPHKIEISRSLIPDIFKAPSKMVNEIKQKVVAAQSRSFGILINSFHDLEADFKLYYEMNLGMKTWAIGPVSSWINKDVPTHGGSEVIDWLDLQEPNSVLYICFGSLTIFPDAQLLEIAHALADSGYPFVWVVRKIKDRSGEGGEGHFLDDFEERMKQEKKGLIIRKWAPQIMILNHPAIKGFLSHCGWNSILESIYAGQPILSWPITAEHFYIEKLMTHVAKIAFPVGARRWWSMENPEAPEILKREQIMKSITFLMSGGEEVDGMRERARELRRAVKKAVSPGGSSYNSLTSVIEELVSIKQKREKSG